MRVLDFSVNFIYYFFYFLPWYYLDNFSFWSKFIPRTLLLTINGLAVAPMLRNLFEPYRAIHSWVAYVMGFLIRLAWILVSLVLIMATLVFLLFLLALYLSLPFVLLIWLGHGPDRIFAWPLIALLGCIYFFLYIRRPKHVGDLLPEAERLWNQLAVKPYSPALFIVEAAKNRKMQMVFNRLNLNPEELLRELKKSEPLETQLSWRSLLAQAKKLRVDLGHRYLDLDLLFLALIKLDKGVELALSKLEHHPDEVVETVRWIEARQRARESFKFWRDEYFHLWAGPDRAWVAGFLPNLKHFSTDITQLVASGRTPRVVARQKDVDLVLAVLNRTTQNNVVLVGPAGVGKTSLVYAIAQEMLTGQAAGKLSKKKLISLDVGAMLAGASARGELEARIKAALAEVQTGQVVLFIDEIETLLQAGFNYFLPSLSAGAIQLIGTATPENFRKYIESNAQIAALFQVVRIAEPDKREVYEILENVALRIEKEQKVIITFPAIQEAVRLTRRYVHDRVLPDKAIDLLDEAAVRKRQEAGGRGQKARKVTAEDVAKVLTQKINIPLEKITQTEADKLLHLEKFLHQRIVGQYEAVSAIANALRRARSGLGPKNRPLASFLFIGPTGVGKTETAKALAKSYFGSEQNMVRLDMSEYQDAHTSSRLIGSPPGFPGYEAGGQLTEAVRRQPFTVILADEFEKAHPDVLNLFLQIMDDGRLTDGLGKTADFTNTMIIATSNAFSQKIYEYLEGGKLDSWKRELDGGIVGELGKKEVGATLPPSADQTIHSSYPATQLSDYQVSERYGYLKDKLLVSLQKVFKPELLNRFDDIIVFRPLKFEEQIKITRLLLNQVTAELAEKDISVSFTNDLVEELVELGIDPKLGARPLRRVIQAKVENPLAEKILKGELKAGDEVEVGVEILKSKEGG